MRVSAPTIEIYGRKIDGRDCPHCLRAVRLCQRKGYRHVYYDITDDQALQDEFVTRTNGAQTVPQIFVGIHRIGGADDLARADTAGTLQQMIGGM